MATTLTATHRITLTYVCTGFTHLWRGFCKVGSTVLGVRQLVCRDGITEISWKDGIEYWGSKVPEFADCDATMSALLEVRSGTLWNPLDADAFTVGLFGGTFAPASQYTAVVRDTAFKKIRVVLMEGFNGYVGHAASGYGINAGLDDMSDVLNGNDADPLTNYQWQKSRGDNYILASGAIAGVTLDLNDKLKRARGLE